MPVFLPYGVREGDLVHIEETRRGKTDLRCPYCEGQLVARKSEKVAPHFAHVTATCNALRRRTDRFQLPAWDRFDLSLPARAVEALRTGRRDPDDMRVLLNHDLIVWNAGKAAFSRSGDGYELSRPAQVIQGTLSMRLFAEWQLQRWTTKMGSLETGLARAEARGAIDVPDLAMDLRLFAAQKARILGLSLYFLKIGMDGWHKIGVTARPLKERIAEIQRDVRPYLGDMPVTTLDVWPGRGRLEYYFLHRYTDARQPLGDMTEYLRFADADAKVALTDLRRVRNGN